MMQQIYPLCMFFERIVMFFENIQQRDYTNFGRLRMVCRRTSVLDLQLYMNISNTRFLVLFLLASCCWLVKGARTGFGVEQGNARFVQSALCKTFIGSADSGEDRQSPSGFAIVGETDQVLKKPPLPVSTAWAEFYPGELIRVAFSVYFPISDRIRVRRSSSVPYYILFRSLRIPHPRA